MRQMTKRRMGPAILIAVLLALLVPLAASAQATHDCTIVSDSDGVVSITCVRKPTPVPATETPTALPTETPTLVLPTATMTPTATSILPTVTPSPTATATRAPPTPTATDTATLVPTATATKVPTATPTKVPTNTPTSVPAATATKVPTSTPISLPTATPVAASDGIWLSRAEIMALPTSGAGWDEMLAAAKAVSGSPNVSNQDSDHSTGIMAAALVYARTGEQVYLDKVLAAIRALATGNYESGGRALAFGREFIGYVLSADLVNLKQVDPALDAQFRTKIRSWLDAPTSSGPDSLRICSDDRPNNWGTHCTASRIAIDLYLGDTVDLAKAVNVFKGWLGDRSAYSDFTYGDLWWQANPNAPVGVNPKGSTIQGYNVDGLEPEEMRRGGSFKVPPTYTDYAWEGNQGALASTWMLKHAGYNPEEWEDRAECRAGAALYRLGSPPDGDVKWQPTGDDQWQPWLLNKLCGTSYPTPGGGKGKNVGWTRWAFGN